MRASLGKLIFNSMKVALKSVKKSFLRLWCKGANKWIKKYWKFSSMEIILLIWQKLLFLVNVVPKSQDDFKSRLLQMFRKDIQIQ
jgi:hypothetical protein